MMSHSYTKLTDNITYRAKVKFPPRFVNRFQFQLLSLPPLAVKDRFRSNLKTGAAAGTGAFPSPYKISLLLPNLCFTNPQLKNYV